MRYEKPEIKIEKFSIVENIMDDGALGNIFSID